MRASPAAGVLALAALVAAAGCLDASGPAAVQADGERPMAERLLGPATAEVVVVAHAPAGREPAAATVAAVEAEFTRLLGKPVRVQVEALAGHASRAEPWTGAELEALAAGFTSQPWPPGTALLHVASLPGCFSYTEYDPARGCIEGGVVGDVAFVMTDQARDEPGEVPLRDAPLLGWYAYERYLYVHELGHVAGLVGLAVPDTVGRAAEAGCACHSTDTASVMYQFHRSTVASPPGTLVERILDDNVHHYTFSDLDIADVRAYQDSLR